MARPNKAHKDAAFGSQNAAATAAAGCAGAAGPAVFIPVAGPFVAAALGAVSAALSVRAIQQGKIVRDPPRDDFRSPTEPQPSALEPGVLPDSLVREPAIGLVVAADEAARFLEAAVTALERASGAELAGDSDAFQARLDEAHAFLESVATGLESSSRGAQGLRDALMPYRELRSRAGYLLRVRRVFGRSRLIDELPRAVLPQVERVGLPERALRIPLRVTDDGYPVQRAIAELDVLAQADIAYAEYARQAASTRVAFESGFPESQGGPPESQGGPPAAQGGPPMPV